VWFWVRVRVCVRLEFGVTVRECRHYNLAIFRYRQPGACTLLNVLRNIVHSRLCNLYLIFYLILPPNRIFEKRSFTAGGVGSGRVKEKWPASDGQLRRSRLFSIFGENKAVKSATSTVDRARLEIFLRFCINYTDTDSTTGMHNIVSFAYDAQMYKIH